MKILPKSQLGKWSVGLLGGAVAVFLFGSVVIVGLLKQQGGNTFADNLYISVPMFVAFGLVVTSFALSVISIWKHKEHSLIIYLPIIIGLLVAIFAIGELVSPH